MEIVLATNYSDKPFLTRYNNRSRDVLGILYHNLNIFYYLSQIRCFREALASSTSNELNEAVQVDGKELCNKFEDDKGRLFPLDIDEFCLKTYSKS